MSRVQRTDITVTVEEWLSKSFWGQMVLWLGDHIKDPHFITSFTLWAVKISARALEPLLLVCAAYLVVSTGIPSLSRPDWHDFSLSILTGAPDVILPGGFVTVWQKFSKKEHVAGSILTLLLIALAALTGVANANIFKVIQIDEAGINQLLFWRAMLGMAYSTTIIITLLTKRHAQDEMTLSALHLQLDREKQEGSSLREQLEEAHGIQQQQQELVSRLHGQLGSEQQAVSALRIQLEAKLKQVSDLQEQLDGGQTDVSELRRALNAANVTADTLRAQLDGSGREIESLKEALTGSEAMQQSRVQQLLLSEQKQVERLHQQLEDGQEATTTLRRQLNTTNMQVIDLTGKLEIATRRLENLQNADEQVHDLSTKLEQKNREFAIVSGNLQTANRTITNLQKAAKQVEDLTEKLQKKEQDCERMKGQIAELLVKVRESERVKGEGISRETGQLSQGKITSIDQARVKVKASDAEVLAYMKEHSTLKVPEVANHFEVTPRTIYNILKRQETEEKSESEAVGQP